MSAPEVHSPSLKTALETDGTRIDNFTATLDQISGDIKALEKWLHESGVRIEVEVGCTGTTAIAWASATDGGTWRILHREYGDQWDTPRSSRPLIEMPVPVRLTVARYGALAFLVKSISERIPQYDADISIEGDLCVSESFDGPPPDGVMEGFNVCFVPAGASEEGRPVKFYSGHQIDEMTGNLAALGSPDVANLVGTGAWGYHTFRMRCTVSFRALRRLGLIG